MLSILYNLLEILVVLVPILLSVAFMTVIERKVMGSMQRRIGPNVVGYYALLQPFAFLLKLAVIVIAGFTTFILFNSLGFEPIFCEETLTTKNETVTVENSWNWSKNIISGAWGASMLYIIHKGLQMKGSTATKVASITSLVGSTTVAATTMIDVTRSNPAGVQSRLNQALAKTFPAKSESVIPSSSSHPFASPLEENWSIFDWLFSFLPDFVKQEIRNRVPSIDFEKLDTIGVLYFQYNIIVFLLVISLFIILYSYITIIVFRYCAKNRDSIVNKSTLLNKFIPSENMLHNLIILFKLCIVVNMLTGFAGLHFLFTHPFEFVA